MPHRQSNLPGRLIAYCRSGRGREYPAEENNANKAKRRRSSLASAEKRKDSAQKGKFGLGERSKWRTQRLWRSRKGL